MKAKAFELGFKGVLDAEKAGHGKELKAAFEKTNER